MSLQQFRKATGTVLASQMRLDVACRAKLPVSSLFWAPGGHSSAQLRYCPTRSIVASRYWRLTIALLHRCGNVRLVQDRNLVAWRDQWKQALILTGIVRTPVWAAQSIWQAGAGCMPCSSSPHPMMLLARLLKDLENPCKTWWITALNAMLRPSAFHSHACTAPFCVTCACSTAMKVIIMATQARSHATN